MRFLGIGDDGDLGDMYYRLSRAGHDVRMCVLSPASRGVYAGMVPQTLDWRADLAWIRDAGNEGIVVFETASHGAIQDRLREEGYQVIGGSAYGDRLESDRNFGQDQLDGCGLCIAESHRFTDFDTASHFVRSRKARFVYKSNGADSPRARNYVGQMENGDDMVALLTAYKRQWQQANTPDFVLMDHIEGIEVGVGAYFNGETFLHPACLDWEHKRFFTGELGELTGEMGTIVTYRGAERLFARTLGKMSDRLRLGGYCGYINLNLMVNQQGIWPIEFTSRFGYPGFAICEALHEEPWDDIFIKLLRKSSPEIRTRAGFAAGVVLTVPPFPYRHGYSELSRGVPITFSADITADERAALHFAEVEQDADQLVMSGSIGYVGVATGIGATIAAARDRAYDVARKVVVPNLRYRTDIGARVIDNDFDALVRLGHVAA